MITVDRQRFFSLYRDRFGSLTQPSVDNLNYILDRFETEQRLRTIPHHAYVLATAWHEGAIFDKDLGLMHRFVPIREKRGSSGSAVWIKYQSKYWNTGFYGRGICQLTWLTNYRKFSRLLGLGDLFVENPDLVLQIQYSYDIAVIGMALGEFRANRAIGKISLEKMLPGDTADLTQYYQAREIVNGDKKIVHKGSSTPVGLSVAYAADKFDTILRGSMISHSSFTDPVVAPVGPPDDPNASPEDPAGELIPITTNPTPSHDQQPDDSSGDEQTSQQPQHFFNVEDWKNFCLRWLKRIWGVGVPANMTQAFGFITAAVQDPDRGPYYIGIGAFLFIVIAGIGLLLTVGLVGLLWWNRKEIAHQISEARRSIVDPTLQSSLLIFEKK